MKKLVAALLVLTMVLALTGSAMAGCKFSIHQYVKFNKNAYAYTEPKNSKKTNDPATIISKGSIGCVEGVSGDWVRFSNGGVGLSKPLYRDAAGNFVYFKDEGAYRISDNCYKHVKATAKVWLHYTPSLSNSYGKALVKDQKVKYRRAWSLDERLVPFYGVRYNGKCLWVSSLYTKLVK